MRKKRSQNKSRLLALPLGPIPFSFQRFKKSTLSLTKDCVPTFQTLIVSRGVRTRIVFSPRPIIFSPLRRRFFTIFLFATSQGPKCGCRASNLPCSEKKRRFEQGESA